jgi:hypothetical protein
MPLSRGEKATAGAVITLWVLGVLAGVAFWGTVAWAIIKLTNANS